MSKLQWSLALAAAAGPLAWWWSEVPRPDAAGQAPQTHRAVAASESRNPVDLRLEGRGLPSPSRDPFATPPKPPAARQPNPVVEIAQAPKAPPLPFRYEGSGELQGKSFVFLARQNRAFMVSAGDTIDGTYSVEAVARDRVVLRYLPLGIRQVMMYSGAEAPPEVAAAPESTSQPVALQVDMPAEVVLGQEFVVTLGLPGGVLKATVEIGYDAEVLSMVGAKPRRPGRAVVEVASGNGPRAQLRFKVLADAPVFTDIDVQASATDAGGKRVAVSVPSVHTVSLVLPGA